MRARLYAVPGSHPSVCVERALQLKGIDYERVDLLLLIHRLQQRVRFGQPTVPGLELDGERIVGSTRILRRLDELAPEPPLYPRDEPARRQVEDAERWGDEVLQPAVRRFSYALLRRDTTAMPSYAEGARLPIPLGVAMLSAGLIVRLGSRVHGASDAAVIDDIRQMPDSLDHVDGLIVDGVIGQEPPNAADLQIGSSLRLLSTFGDAAALLADRPCAELARRLFPDFSGETPAGTAPPDWVSAAPQAAAART